MSSPYQWIGLVENLQENPIFNGKNLWVSGSDFPVKTNPLTLSYQIPSYGPKSSMGCLDPIHFTRVSLVG